MVLQYLSTFLHHYQARKTLGDENGNYHTVCLQTDVKQNGGEQVLENLREEAPREGRQANTRKHEKGTSSPRIPLMEEGLVNVQHYWGRSGPTSERMGWDRMGWETLNLEQVVLDLDRCGLSSGF